MGLVLVCPQCQANVLLQSQNCPYCQADLRNLTKDQRRYGLGQPGPSTPSPTPTAVSEAAPALTEGVPMEAQIRRPHVRRYAAPPVSETHPVVAKSAKTKEAAAPESKPPAKKAKKPATKKKK